MIHEFRQVQTTLKLEEKHPLYSKETIRTPDDAIRILADTLKDRDREYVVTVNLDDALHPINFNILTMGGISNCTVPREKLFQSAMLSNASAIMVLHNHPSGSLEPSPEDIQVTQAIIQAGNVVNIPVIDHIIISTNGSYSSIRESHPELFTTQENFISEVRDPGHSKASDLLQKLQDGVQAVFESQKYQDFLTAMGKFHRYSINNSMLIAMQKPDATLVKGYAAWQKDFGRQVKKGEKAIQILAPITVKQKTEEKVVDENGIEQTVETEYAVPRFKVASVFDISQTYGPAIPTIAPSELMGKVAMYEDIMGIITEVSPVPVRFDDVAGEAKGYYSSTEKQIVIKAGLPQAQSVKTAIHEVCHAILHDKDALESRGEQKDRQTKEVEAESVAFVTCSALGLDTSDYSFPYVAGWSSGKEMKVLQDSLATIRATSDSLISQIEERLDRISRYEVYQIHPDGKLGDKQFSSYEDIGNSVDVSAYKRVYMARLHGESLDDIYTKLNLDIPSGYQGHSLSVSDVIVLHQDGTEKAYYVDKFGFQEIPDFKGKEKREADYDYQRSNEAETYEKRKQKSR